MMKMRLFPIMVIAIVAASMGSHAAAPDKGAELKAARVDYDKAVAKSKADYSAASKECKAQPQEKQSACLKQARADRRKARNDANEAYAKVGGKPDPSPGH
jgi:hypothetical protein